ncbi:MAG: hypothetical protein ACKV2T_05395 [Kofleriaceae bacterium]
MPSSVVDTERMQPVACRDVSGAMRASPICVYLAVAACAPRWIQPEFREEAEALAIEAAMREHACPRDQVSVRCDASSSMRLTHGRMVVYDDDGVIGTYVEETPEWEIELAVCGHLRRYRFRQPELPRTDGVWATRTRSAMVEVQRTCGGAYCLGAEPACTNCGREHWWPVDTMPSSTLCADAIDDGTINAEVHASSVELVLVVDEPRDLPRRCGESPLFVTVDGVWFNLCGDGTAHLRPGIHRIPTGITLGVNTKGGRDHDIQAFDARADRCRRSQAMKVVLRRTALSWDDLTILAPP